MSVSKEFSSNTSSSPFTLRAVAIGCVCCFCLSAGDVFGVLYLRTSYMALGTSMPGAVFLLFCLTMLINPALKSIHPRAGLSRRELLLIYIMLAMASPIPTHLVRRLIGAIASPVYFATPENQWLNLIVPHIQHWLMPHDPALSRLYYEGGAQGQAIPWQAWQSYFLVWTPLVWAMFLLMICTMVVMRKQWIRSERLIYPLMQVPLSMTEEGDRGERLSPFYKNPVMWAGFAIPAFWGTMHGLYNYFPSLIPIAHRVDPIHFNTAVFDSVTPLYVALRFNILGFFYFLKTEIAFSLWFFNLLSYGARGVFSLLGLTSVDPVGGHAVSHPIFAHQTMGALLVLFAGGLWTARGHLREVLGKAFAGASEVDDSGEILSYRSAVVLLVLSGFASVVWLTLAGLPAWVGITLVLLIVVVIYGYARIVAEGGLSDGSPPVNPANILVSAVGSSVIGNQGLVILITTHIWTTGRNFVMVGAANALRLAEEFTGNRRPLFWVMLLALAVAVAGAGWMNMVLAHEYGAINLASSEASYNRAERLIRSPFEPEPWNFANTGIGALVMAGLMGARRLYAGWPLHPLGYVIGPIWIMDHLWFNMFLAWLIKVAVLKYGGARLYLKTRPFFMGLILGYYTPGGFFMIVDAFTGMRDNVIFYG